MAVRPDLVEHVLKMHRTEMSMIRWMCGVKPNERKKNEELRELLGSVLTRILFQLEWVGIHETFSKQI